MNNSAEPAGKETENRIRTLMDAALAAHRSGDMSGAEEGYCAILLLAPDHADALHLLGMCRHQGGAGREAFDLMSHAISVRADAAEYHNTLGAILRGVREFDSAIQSFTRAVRLRTDYRDARNNLALALCDIKRFSDAETVLRDSLVDNPEDPALLTGMGRLRLLTDETKAAAACFHDALKVAPDHVDALNNLGVAFKLLNDPDGARAAFERALALNPSHIDAHYNYAQLLLLFGDYAEAWPHFEWRLRQPDYRRKFTISIWQGEALAGETVLVWCEQGLGDAIHFIRYAPMVAARGGKVVVECAKPLARLVAGVPGVSAVYEMRAAPDIDLHIPIMSLPCIFETTVETIPADIPYVAVASSSSIDAKGARLKVGLIWAGNPENVRDRSRSRTLSEFAPLAALDDVAFFSLQVGAGTDDPPPPGMSIVNLMPTVKDFYDTAADIAGLDLITSIDSSSAHLAGAIGAPVWVLLDSVADWRWLRDGDRTAWYPTMRLFRNSNGWPALFQDVADALKTFEPVRQSS